MGLQELLNRMKVNLTDEQRQLAKSIIFAEAAGGPNEEIEAVASTLINRINKHGFDKAIQGYSSYTTQSPQFIKAAAGDLNEFEQKKFKQYGNIFDGLTEDVTRVSPYTHHENINAFGEPKWAKGQKNFKDIGRQRFYIINE